MRAALYARVSTEEQAEGWSLDAQIGACRAFCQSKGWSVAAEYVDAGISGTTGQRPQLLAMMAAAEAGAVDVVICHKLDRFFRNLRQLLAALDRLREIGVAFVSVSENLDFSASWGKVALVNLGIIAEIYVDNLRQEARKGKRQRALSGKSNASIPAFGYRKDADKLLAVDAHEAEAVRLAFEWYATGTVSYSEIASRLNSAGYRLRGEPWRKAAAAQMLKNPVYLGVVVYEGQWIDGQHEAILPRALWDRVEQARAARAYLGRATGRAFRQYRLSGLVYCAHCGGRLGFDTRVKQGRAAAYLVDRARYRAQRCPANAMSHKAATFYAQLDAVIARLQLPTDWREQILTLANGKDNGEAIRKERDRLQEKLKRLTRAFVECEISEIEYHRERDAARAKLARLVVPQERDLGEAGALLENLADVWQEANEMEKRELLGLLFARVHVDLDAQRIVALEPTAAFAPWLARMLQPLDGGRLDPGPWEPEPPAYRGKYTGALASAMAKMGRKVPHSELTAEERAALAEYRRTISDARKEAKRRSYRRCRERLTPEQIAEQRAKWREANRRKRESMTAEELEEHRRKVREAVRKSRAKQLTNSEKRGNMS